VPRVLRQAQDERNFGAILVSESSVTFIYFDRLACLKSLFSLILDSNDTNPIFWTQATLHHFGYCNKVKPEGYPRSDSKEDGLNN